MSCTYCGQCELCLQDYFSHTDFHYFGWKEKKIYPFKWFAADNHMVPTGIRKVCKNCAEIISTKVQGELIYISPEALEMMKNWDQEIAKQ